MTETMIPVQAVQSILEINLFPFEETEDPNIRAHIVNPSMNMHVFVQGMTTGEMVDSARIRGIELTALCGYRWVPRYDPEKFDACTACFKIAGLMMSENGE